MKIVMIILLAIGVKALPAQDLTSQAKKQVIDSFAHALVNNYVFPDTARLMADHLLKQYAEGRYNGIGKPHDFAAALSRDARSIYNDAHLSVTFNAPVSQKDATPVMSPAERRRLNLVEYGYQNFGFKKLEIMSGNIGYLSFDRFYAFNDQAREVVNSAFSFLKYADALIIDLRNNGGGSPDMLKHICSFILPPGTQLTSYYERRTGETETAFTYETSIAQALRNKPVYILTNKHTFSAAEEFAYDLKALGRATIIGETTGGGAHAVGAIGIGNGFSGLVPYARAINPITGHNWETVGVTPDIVINADSSLDAAVLRYYDHMIAHATDSLVVKKMRWPRDLLNAKLHPAQPGVTLLQSYAGNYENRVISFESGELYYTGTTGKKSKLVALANDCFKLPDIDYLKIKIVKGEAGAVSSIAFSYEDGFEITYKKQN